MFFIAKTNLFQKKKFLNQLIAKRYAEITCESAFYGSSLVNVAWAESRGVSSEKENEI